MTVKNPADAANVTIPKAGVYQVDLYGPAAEPKAPVVSDASHLTEGLSGNWTLSGDGPNAGTLRGKAAVLKILRSAKPRVQ